VNRRCFAYVLGGMILAVSLLIQRSMTTYYAYRCSELEQDKKILLKQTHALEIEVHKACRPEVLYAYWAEHRDQFEFDIPGYKPKLEVTNVAVHENVKPKAKTTVKKHTQAHPAKIVLASSRNKKL
jgi:hypothetical protein